MKECSRGLDFAVFPELTHEVLILISQKQNKISCQQLYKRGMIREQNM